MQTLIGKKAPSFQANAVIKGNQIVEGFSLDQFVGKQEVVFFFYPLDFTFVCPTELIAFQDKLAEFEKRNVAVVGCSVDSEYSHFAWLNTERNKGGIKGVTYPLVADLSKTISENYGVLASEYDYDADGNATSTGAPVAYRGLFLIDKNGVVRHSVINDLPLGRNVDEAIRMVDALHHFEENGEVCPANWSKGEEAMQATAEGVAEYLSK
ncbi:redoxin domain-containing protein [Marinifilum sp. N1E240]|uniref:peroxiredoxin n=1 Tax=Marinifilum sp. N1E240 TaxID=2608082 RepID=UPI00128B42E7|nr:peroxiredoxin [Marinifilum sp. N1E240]MPQ46759.1 redoxin domain-containing protein [Marinifilum sp. N1E240]|eukprot:TRINITY_DN286_c0_g2_i1.p1 TRINITY_DN286_c0_g2~~TRINITY_DN286_c0_g2_i1.p1  ORF type:complete len:210 (-),score=59.50 TRINITY_DN286_c0_g2_i1:557-1186(-)